MGRIGEQPAREILFADKRRKEIPETGTSQLGPALRSHWAGSQKCLRVGGSAMRWLRKIPLRLRSLLRGDAVDQELTEEMRFHLERQIAENLAAGMSPQEARQTLLEFGGVEQVKEECRDTRRVRPFEDLISDLRFAGRMLRRSPGF